MAYIITPIVFGFILILAVPYILDSLVKKRGYRKGLKILSKILGYLLIILGAYNLVTYVIVLIAMDL